tara:strand:+ start:168 stop:398 length:231 start_codon:yes stop_codon:yes gene_type:complete
MMVETVNEGKAKYKIVSIGVGDFVKEIRKNRVGVVKDINTKLNRFFLEFPDMNEMGWFALKEIRYIQINNTSKVAQ